LNLTGAILDKAKIIYKKFEEAKKRTIRGSRTDGIIAAVLYLACKEEKVPRTFKELARDTSIDEKDIRKLYKVLSKELPKGLFESRSNVVAPADLVIRICDKLGHKQNVVTLATQIAKNAAPKLEGKSPSSIAAASIFMATKTNEKEIARAASISAATIRNIFKEMQQWESEIIPSDRRDLIEGPLEG